MILNIRSKLLLSYLAMAVLTVLASAYAVGHLRDLNKLASQLSIRTFGFWRRKNK